MKNNRLNIQFIVFIILFFLFIAPLYGKDSNSSVTLHRFALIIGSNNGGDERAVLRYATKDALSFAQVMKDMGAVYNNNIIVLIDPSKKQVESSFIEMTKKVAAYYDVPGRKELLVYYSGHSNEEGLLLFGEMYSYKQFRDEISNVKADVRVAILDSCSSGAFTRTKGVIRQPSFLVDSSNEMEGYAFLTSSAEDEAAQESDAIEASFFTHYLVSGLRGAADTSKDGMVSLNEAYYHAFSETLARTERTQYGPQHPKYDIQLTGTGDLVLTDIRETSASLLLVDELEGRLFIRDKSGHLIVELRKNVGHMVELGLEPGKYEITLDHNKDLLQGSISLKRHDRKILLLSQLTMVDGEKVAIRGEETSTIEINENTNESGLKVIPFHYSFVPSFYETGFLDMNYTYTFSLNLLLGTAANINGFQVASIGNITRDHMYGGQGSGIFNYVGGMMYGFQGSGIGNITIGEVIGYQGSGIFNFSGGNVSYVQIAGIINLALGRLTGFQGSGIVNYATEAHGFQCAGIVNITNRKINGLQVAGICNVARNNLSGAQIAGISNYSSHTDGAQIAGIVNVAGDLNGFQGGLVNKAGNVSGLQLGLVNVADNYTHGFPIGLINIEKNGVLSIDMWYDAFGYTHLGLRVGTKNTYAIITSAMIVDSEPLLWSYGFGWGIHIPLSIFSFDSDITCNFLNSGVSLNWENFDERINLLPRIRTSLGMSIGNFITLFAGYSFNVYSPWLNNDYTDDSWEINFDIFNNSETLHIGSEFFAGVSFHL